MGFAPKESDGDLPISPAEVNALLRGGDVGVQGRAVLKERKLRDVRLRALSAIAEPLPCSRAERFNETPVSRYRPKGRACERRTIGSGPSGWPKAGRRVKKSPNFMSTLQHTEARCPVLQRVALCCSALSCVAAAALPQPSVHAAIHRYSRNRLDALRRERIGWSLRAAR